MKKPFSHPYPHLYPGKYVSDSRGAVMIIGLLLLTILMTLGYLMMHNMSTEVVISGNYETTTKSLLIAEGGLEIVKGQLKSQVSSVFSASGYSSGNTQQYLNGNTPATTITNPMNWIGTTVWYTTLNSATLALSDQVTSSNLNWPIYQKVAIGSDYAVVGLERPIWMSSNPGIVKLSITSQTDNVSNTELLNRRVAGVLEINLGNNFLTFQAFTDPADQINFLDNKTNNSVVIGIGRGHSLYAGTEYDKGIYWSDAITGISTYNVSDKIAVIQTCTAGAVGSFTTAGVCTNYGVPEINTTNYTFILGKGHGCLFGGVATGATIAVGAAQRYLVTYADTTSITCP